MTRGGGACCLWAGDVCMSSCVLSDRHRSSRGAARGRPCMAPRVDRCVLCPSVHAGVFCAQVCPTAAPSPMCAPRAASSRRLVVAGRAAATRRKHPAATAAAAHTLGRGSSCSSSGSRVLEQRRQHVLLAGWVLVRGCQVAVCAAGVLSYVTAQAVLSKELAGSWCAAVSCSHRRHPQQHAGDVVWSGAGTRLV